MLLVGDGAAVASCPMRRGGGFLPDAARRWLLARCGAAVASCRWAAAVASFKVVICRRMYCAPIARVGGCQSFGNLEQDVANRGRM